jgi:hypothetical protein
VAISVRATTQRCIHTSIVFQLSLLSSHDARYAAKHLRCLQRRRNEVLVAFYMLHVDAQLQRAVDLAVLHEISPRNSRVIAIGRRHVALLYILGQVQFDVSESYPLAPACACVFLYDFELQHALLQHAILVDSEPDGQRDVIVVEDFVIADGAAVGAAAMLGRTRV